MNIFRKKLVLPLVSLFVLFVLPFNALAVNQTFNGRNIVTLNSNQVIDHDYFAAGSRIVIDGTINGDAYIAGGQIDVNGSVTGDLLVAGGQITIRGNVAQNVRAVGGNILVLGNVGRNISLAGGNITIEKNAKIVGNAVIAGGNSEMLSQIKDLTIVGGNARLGATVLGNVTAAAGMLEITQDATINGNLDYWSNNKATIASGAKVLKSTTFHQTHFNRQFEETKTTLPKIKTFFSITSFISSLILGILFIWLLPIYSQKTASIVTGKFWLSLLVGLITLIVTPIVIVLLFISLIGIPIAIAFLFAYGFLIYLAKLFVALAIGNTISSRAKWKTSSIWSFIIGLLLYYVIGFIPIIGGLTKIIVLFVGLGALIMQKKYYLATLRDKKIL